MEDMTVRMVREYLRRRKSVILPLGVIEQHGYHLPLRTDALIATHLARRIGRKAGVLVAPTIHQSFSGGGLPGTMNISPAVMSLVVSDTLTALAAQGFRNFYLLLCHGGSENTRALGDALRILLRTNPAFSASMIVLMPVWKLGSKNSGFARGFRERDWHAGWVETSVVMALEPGLVRMKDLRLDPAPLLKLQLDHPDNYQRAEKIVDDPLVVPRLTQRPDIRVGVMGEPQKASRKLGQKIVADIVRSAAGRIRRLESKADGVYRPVDFKPEPIVLFDE
jgi:creatinine amidohydrolase